MQHPVNIIKQAIEAAGGRRKVSQTFGVVYWAVCQWENKGRVDAHYILPLCRMGQFKVEPMQILHYMEQVAEAKKSTEAQEQEVAA